MKNPPLAEFYLCDIVRLNNIGDKPDLLGLYPGAIIGIILSEDSIDPSRDHVVSIAKLNLYGWILNQTAGPAISFDILAPDGESIFVEPLELERSDGVKEGPVNVVVPLDNFPVVQLGDYTARLIFEKHTYNFIFKVIKLIRAGGLKLPAEAPPVNALKS